MFDARKILVTFKSILVSVGCLSTYTPTQKRAYQDGYLGYKGHAYMPKKSVLNIFGLIWADQTKALQQSFGPNWLLVSNKSGTNRILRQTNIEKYNSRDAKTEDTHPNIFCKINPILGMSGMYVGGGWGEG